MRGGGMDPVRGEVAAELRAFAPDLVVVALCGSVDLGDWVPVVREVGARYAVVCQANSEHWWGVDDRLDDWRRRFLEAERVFMVSRGNLGLLQDQLACEIPRAEVIWNPYQVRPDVELAWPEEASGWRLACVARLEPVAKGQDLLLRVLARPVWRDRPLTVTFCGAGSGRRTVEELARRLGVERVRFAGQVEDIEGIWREHHGLVLSSRLEGMPLALLEAAFCGRMAVVTAVGGNAELVTEGETGFVAGSATEEAMAAAMERAWEGRRGWSGMGESARRRVRERVPVDPAGVFARRLLEAMTAAGGAGGPA